MKVLEYWLDDVVRHADVIVMFRQGQLVAWIRRRQGNVQGPRFLLIQQQRQQVIQGRLVQYWRAENINYFKIFFKKSLNIFNSNQSCPFATDVSPFAASNCDFARIESLNLTHLEPLSCSSCSLAAAAWSVSDQNLLAQSCQNWPSYSAWKLPLAVLLFL